ncbi:MAG: hypothetical protein JRJ12_00945 [Deltaproteobacteria bacterium]|nr:hypothetical protein [Deltaproteobacteria bacterium]MBW2070036.1 hypothetical protein [Deltaproteobacteria bacterium]
MQRGGYIAWVVESGRSPEWLLREYRNKIRRMTQIRRALKNPYTVDQNTGRRHAPLTLSIYKRSLFSREKDAAECRKAIQWLVRQGFIGNR